MKKLSINDVYPFPVGEGLRANFLSNSGNLLQLGLRDISQDELLSFKRHAPKCGIFVDQPVILWLFDFGKGGQYDAPFDATLYSREQLQLFNIDNSEQRLAIEMHVVELNGNIIKALRLFTLPHELTIKFLSAVQDQLALTFDKNFYQQKLNQLYQHSINDLLTKIKLYKAGE